VTMIKHVSNGRSIASMRHLTGDELRG